MQKDIFVLTGGGRKGSVKITHFEGDERRAKIECNLDFRPSNATLYIIGDEIAQMTLNNNKMTVEVPFVSKDIQG